MDFKVTRKNPVVHPEKAGEITPKNFNDWFDGSVVTDPKGLPLPLYHGTDESFDDFNTDEIFMAEDVTVAEDFGNRVLRLAARIKNPCAYDYAEGPPFDREEAINRGHDGWKISNYDTGDEIFRPEGFVWVAFNSAQVIRYPKRG